MAAGVAVRSPGISMSRWGGPGSTNRQVDGADAGAGSTPAKRQAAAVRKNLLNPAPVSVNTQVDPREESAYQSANQYEANVAAGTNEEITRELGRARDEISIGMQREGEAAMSRGADPTLFRSRALQAGARNMSNLQARLADVALGRRNEAINTKVGAAGQAASGQRDLHLGTLAHRLGEERLSIDRAEAQHRMQEAPYERLIEMAGLLGSPAGSGLLGSGFSAGVSGKGFTY